MFWRAAVCLCYMLTANLKGTENRISDMDSLNSITSDNNSSTNSYIIYFLPLFATFLLLCFLLSPAFGCALFFLFCRLKCSTSKHSHDGYTTFLLKREEKRFFSHLLFFLHSPSQFLASFVITTQQRFPVRESV